MDIFECLYKLYKVYSYWKNIQEKYKKLKIPNLKMDSGGYSPTFKITIEYNDKRMNIKICLESMLWTIHYFDSEENKDYFDNTLPFDTKEVEKSLMWLYT